MKKKLKFKKVVFVLIAFYAGYIFISQQLTMNKINKEIIAQNAELIKIQAKSERLQDEIKMSKTNEYVEKLARERLGLVKEGETPVINIEETK